MTWFATFIVIALVSSGCGKRRQAETAAADDAAASGLRDAGVDAEAIAHVDANLIDWLDARAPAAKPPPPLRKKHRRGECSVEFAPRPDRDPNPMCKVGGGTFTFGTSGAPTTVDSFYVDQFEVSAAQAAMFLNARGSNDCPGLDKLGKGIIGPNSCVNTVGFPLGGIEEREGTFVVAPGFERTALLGFSWQGAMEYCAWVGKEVPSSAQWEYAVRHDPKTGKDLRFPWGNDWKPNHASCWLPECKAGSRPKFGASWIGLYDGTRGCGDGSSPWGLHDTVGGTSELVFDCPDPNATCIAGQPCACTPRNASNDGIDISELEPRFRHTDEGRGTTGVRCMRREDH